MSSEDAGDSTPARWRAVGPGTQGTSTSPVPFPSLVGVSFQDCQVCRPLHLWRQDRCRELARFAPVRQSASSWVARPPRTGVAHANPRASVASFRPSQQRQPGTVGTVTRYHSCPKPLSHFHRCLHGLSSVTINRSVTVPVTLYQRVLRVRPSAAVQACSLPVPSHLSPDPNELWLLTRTAPAPFRIPILALDK